MAQGTWRFARPRADPWRMALQIAVTFHIVSFSRIFFRSADLSGALQYIEAMLNFGGAGIAPFDSVGLGDAPACCRAARGAAIVGHNHCGAFCPSAGDPAGVGACRPASMC